MNVRDNSGHRPPWLIEPAELDALADRVLPWPHTAGCSFIDQYRLLSSRRIAFGNVSSAQETDAHRVEIAWRNAEPLGAFVELRVRMNLSFDMETVAIHIAAERDLACHRG